MALSDFLNIDILELLMTTFVLKKYSQEEDKAVDNKEPSKTEIEIEVTKSVSEVIAKALYSYFEKKNIDIEEKEETDSDVKVISTESINQDPITTFKSIRNNDHVLILNKGFTTAKEEWFLLNIQNKTKNVFYTLESFLGFIESKLQQV